MKRAWRLVVVVGAFVLPTWSTVSLFAGDAPGPAVAAGAAAGQEAAELVRRLGDESYAQRIAAETRLQELGLDAREVLLAGLRHADPEIRRSCQRLLTMVLEVDYQRRLKAFAADLEGKQDYQLPGWQRYRELVGDDKESRELFVAMQEAEAALLESVEAGSYEAIQTRLVEVWQGAFSGDAKERYLPSRGTVAALLLACSDPKVEFTNTQQLWSNFSNLLFQGDFAKSLNDGPYKTGARALLAAWLRSPSPTQMDGQKLRFAVTCGVEDVGLQLARQILDNPNGRQPNDAAMAIETVCRLGGKACAALAVPSLGDQRMIMQRGVNNKLEQLQVRDVALAWLVYTTEQKLEDYGFKSAKAWFDVMKQHRQNAFNFGNFFFENAEAREKAFQRWEAWVQEHPLDKPPPPGEKILSKEAPAGGVKGVRIGLPANLPIALGRAGVVPLGWVPGAAAPGAKADAAKEPPATGLRLADRSQVAVLKKAAELSAQGEHAEAASLLGDLMAADEDYFYQPKLDVPLYRHLKAQAELLLAEMPAAGREAYELHYGAAARAQLTQATQEFDWVAVARIEQKYFFTQAGSEAAYLLGNHHRMAARDTQAALYFQRLRDLSPWADRFEPALSIQLAICWHRSGMPQRADEALRRLQARGGYDVVEVGGQPHRLFSAPADAAAWLEGIAGPTPRVEPQWPVFRGDSSGSNLAAPGAPYLQAPALAEVSEHPLLRRVIAQVGASFPDEHRTLLPTLYPLVTEGVALIRTPTGLCAYDLESGALRWQSPEVNGLWHLLKFADAKELENQQQYLAEGLRQRLWEDPAFGTLSTNGRLVFAVEDAGFRVGPSFRKPTVRRDGRREVDRGPLKSWNRLLAFDVRSGKLRWEAGGPAEEPQLPLARGRFLGPPLPLGDQAYAVVEFPEQTLLVSLDAQSGAVLQQWVLDLPQELVGEEFLKQNLQVEVPDPPRGVSPVYAQGAIVCCTGQGRYVAVDLASRSMRWSFLPPEPNPPAGMNIFAIQQQRKMMQRMQSDRADQWCDGGAVIAGQRVLITPWGRDELYCLNLADGALVWTAPRQDGLYLAGVDRETVAVVGRGGVRALRLADGTDLRGPIAFPPGTVPSGRGYLSEGRVYVPLASAEVVAVDLAQGRLQGRSFSPDSTVPGNLVRVENAVVSWGPQGLRRFETLDARWDRLAADAARPDSPAAQLARAEIQLYRGQIDQALQLLQQTHTAQPTPQSARLLGEALLQVASRDLVSWQAVAVDVEQTIQDAELRARFLERLATSYRESGQLETAFEMYLKVVDSAADPAQFVFLTPGHRVRRSLSIQASLLSLLQAAPAELRTRLDEELARRLQKEPSPAGLEYFGFHPAAQDARLLLAAKAAAGDGRLQAELWLRRVLREGSPPQHAAAVAQLADLLQAAGKLPEAARCYALLGGPLAETVCREQRTGRQLVEALPADAPVRGWLGDADPWPAAEPAKEVAKTDPQRANQFHQYSSLLMAGDGSPLAPWLGADLNLQTRKLLTFDAQGVIQSELELAPQNNPNQFWVNNYALNESRLAGHLLVVWLGTRIVAVDQLTQGGKLLWGTDTLKIDPNQWWMMPQLQMRMQLVAQAQGKPTLNQMPQQFAVTTSYVAFQQNRLLTAVDPLTGQTLWMRDDLPTGCDMFGDEALLLVTPPDGTKAYVLSAVDGRELGRKEVPARNLRLLQHGHRLLTWEEREGRRVLKLADPWSGNDTWSRTFSAKAAVWPAGGSEVAVLEPDGQFVLLAVADGGPLFETKLAGITQVDSMFALRNARRLLLFVNGPEPKQEGPIFWNQVMPGHLKVEGHVFSFDVAAGKQQWVSEVKGQSIKSNYPTQAPILTFFRRHQKAIKMDNNSWRSDQPSVHLRCLDGRSGATLHDTKIEKTYDEGYRLQVDPGSGKVEVSTRLETVTLQYQKGT